MRIRRRQSQYINALASSWLRFFHLPPPQLYSTSAQLSTVLLRSHYISTFHSPAGFPDSLHDFSRSERRSEALADYYCNTPDTTAAATVTQL